MPVYQINLWVCEVCNHIGYTTAQTRPYRDPVVEPPRHEEWDYIMNKDGDNLLACPLCLSKNLTSPGVQTSP